jgi:SAM-dependent methyltransferase
MSNLLPRLGYAWRRHGPIGLIWVAAYNLVYHVIGRKDRPGGSRGADSFDEEFGTDTGGIREIRSLDVLALPAARYAVRYGPSGVQGVRSALDKLPIDYTRFTFIDYGSGKGRVLFLAAGFPFEEVIGIEFSRELHETALRNLARLTPEITRCGKVSSIHADAALFEPPKSNLVCYFYNPFGPPVMAAVATRLIAHHDQFGYRIIVIYVDPQHREIFEESGKFRIYNEAGNTVVLTTAA